MGSGLLTDKRRRHKMKLSLSSFLSSYFVIVSGNEARWNKLNEIWSKLQTSQNVPAASDRKIIELFTMSSLQNYGCWCRFNTYSPFRGPTMNDLDQYCRVFYLNYDCLVNDFGQSCDVSYTENYNDTITNIFAPFDPATDYLAECQALNSNDACLASACAVDADFVRSVFNFLADNQMDMTYSGFFGFDGSDGSCVSQHVGTTAVVPPVFTQAPVTAQPGVTSPPITDCCGTYPTRYPFHTQNGNVRCCDNAGATYNQNVMECCGSSVALIGACPVP